MINEEEMPFMGMWGSQDLRDMSKFELINALIHMHEMSKIRSKEYRDSMDFLDNCA